MSMGKRNNPFTFSAAIIERKTSVFVRERNTPTRIIFSVSLILSILG
jgi:hypothetical protein